MVVMEETVVVLMICGLWALGAYALYQRFIVVRRLRKRLERYADATFVPAPISPSVQQPGPGTESQDFKRLQQRLEVLERIAVEKEHSLSREIEELRVASR